VESSGISEPIPIARAFTEGTEDSDIDPTERFRLDTMVTVPDTYGFWKSSTPVRTCRATGSRPRTAPSRTCSSRGSSSATCS